MGEEGSRSESKWGKATVEVPEFFEEEGVVSGAKAQQTAECKTTDSCCRSPGEQESEL